MVRLDRLSKRFGAQVAVDALTCEIPAGQIVGFLGPNGAGKTTTLKMLTGMIEPTSGTASICGIDLKKDPIEVKRHIGFVPESGAVFESLTGLEYLEMVAALYGIPQTAARDRIRQFSQQWQASDIFRVAPLAGPASLCHGARRAILCLMTVPTLAFFAMVVWIMHRDISQLLLLVPGMLALPVFALLPTLGGNCVPLSVPVDEAKGVGRSLPMFGAMFVSFILSGIAEWSWMTGWFHWLVLGETILMTCLYATLRLAFANPRWRSLD